MKDLKNFSERARNKALRSAFKVFPERGVNLIKMNWDNLLLLDACRYDIMNEEFGDKFTVNKIISLGSNTPEWIRKTFTDNHYDDIIYVNGNPLVNRWIADDKFFHVENVWQYAWDEKFRTILPHKISEAAIMMKRQFPKKRIIVHYIQPHMPHIGKNRIRFGKQNDMFDPKPFYEAVKNKKAAKILEKSYRENLRIVFDEAIKLSKTLPKKTIISADHGEMLGERGIYFHPEGMKFKQLVEVPLIKIDNPSCILGASIEDKIKKTEEVIRSAIKKHGRGLTLAWTGGKDSTLILWLYRKICKELKIDLPKLMFIDEGEQFSEVFNFVEKMEKEWQLDVEIVRNEDVLKQVKKVGDSVYVDKLNSRNKLELKKIGFNGKTFPFEPESYVGNHLMKTVAMNLFLEKYKTKALMVGIRWDEQKARVNEGYFSDRKAPDHVRVHPILHITERDLWDIMKKEKIPINPLYERGYRSLGAKGTTTKTENIPAWEQDLENTAERSGRRQDKEGMMQKLRDLGYM